MFVDWFTLIAQIINFLILAWLLKRFLYAPVLEAIDEREKKISGMFAEAGIKTQAASEKFEEFSRKKEELDRQSESLMAKAADEVKIKSRQMLEEARIESERLRLALNDALEKERLDLEREIIRKITAEVFATARKTLFDLAGVSLEERMTEVFIKRLRGLSPEEKLRITAVLNLKARNVLVRSAFELSQEKRAGIKSAFIDAFAVDTKIDYETRPEIICGIELTANGYRFLWSEEDYLASLKKNVNDFFSKKMKPEMKVDENSA